MNISIFLKNVMLHFKTEDVNYDANFCTHFKVVECDPETRIFIFDTERGEKTQ